MEVRVLGAVEVYNGRRLAIGGPNQRRIVAALAQRAGEVVSLDHLADITWPDESGPRVERNLRVNVSRLRTALGDPLADRLETHPSGYRLELQPGELDADTFELAASRATRHVDTGEWQGALDAVDEAMAHWRGRPYGEFADEPWAEADVSRLEQLHRALVEARAEAFLGLRLYDEAIAEADLAMVELPLSENPCRTKMLALHQSGRQAEALRTFQAFRARLVEEAGLEPTEALADLDRAIATDTVETADVAGTIRGYEIHELIGTGAFAEVYRAVQPTLDRDVAIKAIRADLANDPDFIRGFEAEAATVARLEHPHIVPLYDFWREPDRAYLVMRWLDGGTVESSLDGGGWSLDRTVRLVEQVGSALDVAHRAGVVHRDVKPANVFLDQDGNAYLGDFGIAIEASAEIDHQASRSHGTPAYSSPEQLRREPVGPATDVFGLGITIYEILAGRLPFPDATDPASLLEHQLHDPIPSLRGVRGELPPALDRVMATATAKDPADRYQRAPEFVEAFSRAVAETPDAPPVAREVASRVTEGAEEVDNPYRGLQAFDEGDVGTFHGRHRLVHELLRHLDDGGQGRRALMLIGASGSGKSSVVRAGLVPALREGRIPGSERWFITTTSPGSDPYESLEAALLRVAVNPPASLLEQLRSDSRGILRSLRRILPDDASTVAVIIDQFEELFTLCDDERTRSRFLDALTVAASEPESPLRLVVTLRADFFDQPLRYPGFADLVKRDSVTVTPLAPDELEQAIVAPAASAGVAFEAGLVARIVADVASQPGALPLMQYALTELFEHRTGSVLTVAAYEHLGGLIGALGRSADAVYEACDDDEKTRVRRVFGRLVTMGEGSEDTRRRVRRSELGSSHWTASVIERYGQARLLTFDRDPATREPTVEVAHEALIREWPRLRTWLDDDREGLRIQRQLTVAATAWEAGGADDEDLLRGARLAAASERFGSGTTDLNESERRFLDSSIAKREADEQAERDVVRHQLRQNRRLRRRLAAVAVVAILALAAVAVAIRQTSRANDQADAATTAAAEAETRRMASDAVQLVPSNRRVALLLAAEAHRRDPTAETLAALQRVLVGSEELLGYLGGGTSYLTVAWLDDERIVAAAEQFVDVFGTDNERLVRIDRPGVVDLAASPDGRFVAAATRSGILRFDLARPEAEPLFHPTGDLIQALAYSPDGERIAAGTRAGRLLVLAGEDLTVELDIAAHPEQSAIELGFTGVVEQTLHQPSTAPRGTLAIAFSDDSAVIATAGWGTARAWDARTGASLGESQLIRTAGAERAVASADAVAVRRTDEDAIELTTVGRFALHREALGLATEPTVVHFEDRFGGGTTPLGSRSSALITEDLVLTNLNGGDVEIRLRDDPTQSQTVAPQLSASSDLALSRDHQRVAVAGSDGIALLSLGGDGLIVRGFELGDPADLAVSPDGALVITSFGEAGVPSQLWRFDPDGVRPVALEPPVPNFVWQFGTSSAGLGWRNDIGFWLLYAATGETGPVFQSRGRPNIGVVFPDDELVAIANQDAAVTVHRSESGEVVAELLDEDPSGDRFMRSLTVDPTGRYFAATSDAGEAWLWSVDSWELLAHVQTGTVEIGFHPSGDIAATSSPDGSILIREVPSLQPTGQALVGATNSREFTYGPWWSEDGRRLVVTSDGSGRLWDVESAAEIGTFPNSSSTIAAASNDGRWLITQHEGYARRWNLDVDAWPAIACRAAGRNMTEQEWEQFGPTSAPYRQTCDQYA